MAPFKKLRTKLGLRKNKAPEITPEEKAPAANLYASIGRYTYGVSNHNIFGCGAKAQFEIGSFCSVAEGVIFMCRGHHPTHTVSSFPFETMFPGGEQDPDLHIGKTGIKIGSDVWIGRDALIMPQVTIGNGAVIGAGAIVTKNVPAYTIVAGVPAKLIRHRFDHSIIESLETIAWWSWSDEKITKYLKDFQLPISEFVTKHQK